MPRLGHAATAPANGIRTPESRTATTEYVQKGCRKPSSDEKAATALQPTQECLRRQFSPSPVLDDTDRRDGQFSLQQPAQISPQSRPHGDQMHFKEILTNQISSPSESLGSQQNGQQRHGAAARETSRLQKPNHYGITASA